ncbi:MAG: hypothetical protein H6707_13135 [Deltaproteobacteria bacterium]|nr:hypothetical protein [Deltaproteobacteria bacterium]
MKVRFDRSSLSLVLLAAALALVCMAACSDATTPPMRDAAPDTGAADLALFSDGARFDFSLDAAAADLAVDSMTCPLIGTADDCSACGDRCPGLDNAGTARVCNAGQCEIQCKGEYYDVNGQVSDGCEYQDKAIHSSEQLALDVGTYNDSASQFRRDGFRLASDDRLHLVAPTDRSNGRPSYFKMGIKDTTFGTLNGWARLDLSNMPAGASYELWGVYVCSNGKKLASETKTANGGQKITVNPPDDCGSFALANDDGTLLVRVRKLSGPHTDPACEPCSYAMEFEP